jgi:RHH-type proline utilization regulon transcriptional repressor/proline dehydrogenase/delta 1-pyrroline-5-carboxylate dehydrogenase
MLKGAMAELTIGNPDRLPVDVGPVITAEARDTILRHVAAMRAKGHAVHALPLPEACAHGTFVAPTIVEIGSVAALGREVFGPVLHVLRYRREETEALLAAIAATGYGLTFGVHSRIDETIDHLVAAAPAGNVYVNRNLIGAVVGVQPFGGHGLSGTGPKAGGPLYLRRLLARAPAAQALPPITLLPGPVGESNEYRLEPRGEVLCVATTEAGLRAQVDAALAAGNHVRLVAPAALRDALPPAQRARVTHAAAIGPGPWSVALVEGAALIETCRAIAAVPGPVRPVFRVDAAHPAPAAFLVAERSVSTNTAAAGGNASLMSLD